MKALVFDSTDESGVLKPGKLQRYGLLRDSEQRKCAVFAFVVGWFIVVRPDLCMLSMCTHRFDLDALLRGKARDEPRPLKVAGFTRPVSWCRMLRPLKGMTHAYD